MCRVFIILQLLLAPTSYSPTITHSFPPRFEFYFLSPQLVRDLQNRLAMNTYLFSVAVVVEPFEQHTYNINEV